MNGIKLLEGKTLAKIEGMKKGSGTVNFTCTDGTRYTMWHQQDCCECVTLEDVAGDPEDLIGVPILQAWEAESTSMAPKLGPGMADDPMMAEITAAAVTAALTSNEDRETNESELWTFYRIQTIKGSVVLRWYGASDYYSLGVSFEQDEETQR